VLVLLPRTGGEDGNGTGKWRELCYGFRRIQLKNFFFHFWIPVIPARRRSRACQVLPPPISGDLSLLPRPLVARATAPSCSHTPSVWTILSKIEPQSWVLTLPSSLFSLDSQPRM